MVRSLVSALLAAAAVVVPGMASAQDVSVRDAFRARMEARGDQRGGGEQRGDRQRSADRVPAQPQQERGEGWQRPERRAPPPVQHVEARQVEARPGGASRGDRAPWRRDRGRDRPAGVFNGEAQARAAADARAQGQRDRRGEDRRDTRRWDGGRGQAYNRGGWDRSRADWRDNAREAYRFDDRRAWNRGWRTDDRYDWNRYRAQNRYAYHLPRYYAPHGWNYGYRRYSIGVTLSSLLWAQDYWIDDPYAYRLPEVYGPYRWVRYYNDALLVDTYSGQVVDTIYDIFW